MGVCVLTWLLLYRPNLGLASYSNGYDTMINGTVVLKGSLYGRRHVNAQNACVPIQNSEEKAWKTGVCLGPFAARWPIVGHRSRTPHRVAWVRPVKTLQKLHCFYLKLLSTVCCTATSMHICLLTHSWCDIARIRVGTVTGRRRKTIG